MFNALKIAFSKHNTIDPLAAETSQASQENSVAAEKLRKAMSKVFDEKAVRLTLTPCTCGEKQTRL